MDGVEHVREGNKFTAIYKGSDGVIYKSTTVDSIGLTSLRGGDEALWGFVDWRLMVHMMNQCECYYERG